jgi:uncharacterized protein (TIRG00374 family)
MNQSGIRLLRLLSLGVAALVLAFVILTANPQEIWQALREVEPGPAGAVALLNLPVAGLFTLRSLLVLNRMGYSMPLRVLMPASVLGNVAGALTPAASGEFLRVTALQRSGGLLIADAIALVAYERLLSIYLLAVSTGVCLAISALPLAWAWASVVTGVGLVFLPWLVATFLLPRLPDPSIVKGSSWLARGSRYLLTMAGQVWLLLKHLPLFFAWSTLTLLTFAIVALQFHLVARSALVHLSFFDGWVTFGSSGFAAIISLLPLGLGFGDGSTAAVLHATGIPLDRAAAIAILVRATSTLPLILMAIASYLYLSRRRLTDFPASTPDNALSGETKQYRGADNDGLFGA